MNHDSLSRVRARHRLLEKIFVSIKYEGLSIKCYTVSNGRKNAVQKW